MNKRCFICCAKVNDNFYMLPTDEDIILKEYNIRSDVLPFGDFIYYVICDQCLEIYLDTYTHRFKYLQMREIGCSNHT